MSKKLQRWLRSKQGLMSIIGALVLILAIGAVGQLAGWWNLIPGSGTVIITTTPEGYACIPTCGENDARMLSLAGTGRETLAGDTIDILFAADPGTANIEIGIFDGDTGGMWDLGTAPLEFTLYADPEADLSGETQVGQWLGNVMPDNTWFDIDIPVTDAARNENGFSYYRMHVRNTGPNTNTWSNFKIRTDGYAILRPGQSAFAFAASIMGSPSPRSLVYPEFPLLTPTTYDGSWSIYMDVPYEVASITVWDGDFDYGNFDCTQMDTNDPDTPSDNDWLPPWAVGTEAVPEGVATSIWACPDGSGRMRTGDPSDDAGWDFLERSPSVNYSITTPTGTTFWNRNPSGNREWEQFKLTTDPAATRQDADYAPNVADDGNGGDSNNFVTHQTFPAGLYHIQVIGMDLQNLNAWRFEYDVIGLCPDDTPCKPFPKPSIIGDTVWYDLNRDGVIDPDEQGIPDVEVQLINVDTNEVVATEITNSKGKYKTFKVPPGLHRVSVKVDTLPSTPLDHTYNYDGVDTPHTAVVDVEIGDEILLLDFGYAPAEEVLVCEVQLFHPLDAGTPGSGGILYAEVDPDSGDVFIRFTQSLNVNDNSYGANTVGWPGGGGAGNHSWRHLWTSDQARFEIKDANGNVVMEFYMDYIEQIAGSPHGFISTGPTDKDGSVSVGDVNWIFDWTTSAQKNLERFCNGTDCVVNGVNLVVDSPPTVNHSSYVLTDNAFSDWMFENYYQFRVRADAFGGSTFGSVEMTDIHNSPAKMGNDQYCVGGNCGLCVPELGTPMSGAAPVVPYTQPAPAAAAAAPALYVASLTGSSERSGSRWTATVNILVSDNNNAPVSGATVSGSWTVGPSETVSCTTGGDGRCSLQAADIRNNDGNTTFTVTDVTHASLEYNELAGVNFVTVNR